MLWILHYVSLCFQVMDSTLLQETGTELNLSHRSEKPELNKSVFFPNNHKHNNIRLWCVFRGEEVLSASSSFDFVAAQQAAGYKQKREIESKHS